MRPKGGEKPETVEIAAVWCYDCKELIEDVAVDVGEELWTDHMGHETETIDEWVEDVE